MKVRNLFLPAVAAGLMSVAGVSHAQVLNYVSTLTLTNPTVNGVTITANGDFDNNVNAFGLGTSDVVGGFQVFNAPAGPAYTPYSSTFTDILAITDQSSGLTNNIVVTGTLSVAANISQVLPGSTSIVLNPAVYSTSFPVNTYFVTLNNFDEVSATGSSRPGSFSYRFSTISTAVPEPSSIAMLIGMGVSGSAFVLRRRRAVK